MQLVWILRLTFLLHFRVEWIARNQTSRNQVILIFVVILDRFNAEKRQTQKQSKYQAKNLREYFPDLCEVNSHCHRETTQDQYAGIDRAERDVEVVAG